MVQVGGARWVGPARCAGLAAARTGCLWTRPPLPLRRLLMRAITGYLASSGLGGRISAERSRGRTASAPINNSSGDAGYSLGCFLWRVDAGAAALICQISKVGGR